MEKQIIGLINQTLKNNSIVFGSTSEQKAHRIIAALLSAEKLDGKTKIAVNKYCTIHYNYFY